MRRSGRGGDVLVTEQFLDRADVVAILDQMGRERMAQRVTGTAALQHG